MKMANWAGTELVNASSEVFMSGLLAVGQELQAARVRLGWDLPAVAKTLRIKQVYLEAIEAGQTEGLIAAAYAIGFIRSYAKMLGLPADALCRRFRAEVGEASFAPEMALPTPLRERGTPVGAVALVVGLLAVIGYVGWYQVSANHPGQVASVPPVPERLAPLADPAPSVAVAAKLADAAAVQPGGVPAAAAPQAMADAVNGAAQSAAALVADAQKVTPAEASATSAAVLPVQSAPAPAAGAPGRITLHANADSWVQVHDAAGNLLLSRILRAGESWQVPASPAPLYMTTGNAGGTEVLVDGQPTASLGAQGAVRRDLLLDPDQVKAGKLAPTAAVSAPVASAPVASAPVIPAATAPAVVPAAAAAAPAAHG